MQLDVGENIVSLLLNCLIESRKHLSVRQRQALLPVMDQLHAAKTAEVHARQIEARHP